MGIPPLMAMSQIHIVKGKPLVGAGIIAAKIRQSDFYDYQVKSHTTKECTIEFFERDFSGDWKNERPKWNLIGTEQYTIEMAKEAGYLKDFSAWKSSPKNMLFARCISNGQKFYCPDVLAFGSVYALEDREEMEREYSAPSAPSTIISMIKDTPTPKTARKSKVIDIPEEVEVEEMPLEPLPIDPYTGRPELTVCAVDDNGINLATHPDTGEINTYDDIQRQLEQEFKQKTAKAAKHPLEQKVVEPTPEPVKAEEPPKETPAPAPAAVPMTKKYTANAIKSEAKRIWPAGSFALFQSFLEVEYPNERDIITEDFDQLMELPREIGRRIHAALKLRA